MMIVPMLFLALFLTLLPEQSPLAYCPQGQQLYRKDVAEMEQEAGIPSKHHIWVYWQSLHLC